MESILKFISVSSIFMTGIVYLSRKYFDKYFDSELEKYKLSLNKELLLFKHDLNQESEKIKLELSKNENEHKIKFNKLYEEYGSIIKETYIDLIKIEAELNKITTIFQGPEWKETKNNFELRDQIIIFENSFEIKRLFFNTDICEKIEFLIVEIKDINHKMYNAKLQSVLNDDLENAGQILTVSQRLKPNETWKHLHESAISEITRLRRNLEREFSKLLGVN
jgi:hypothetical protein